MLTVSSVDPVHLRIYLKHVGYGVSFIHFYRKRMVYSGVEALTNIGYSGMCRSTRSSFSRSNSRTRYHFCPKTLGGGYHFCLETLKMNSKFRFLRRFSFSMVQICDFYH